MKRALLQPVLLVVFTALLLALFVEACADHVARWLEVLFDRIYETGRSYRADP